MEYHKQSLNIAKEIGDKAGTGRSYGNLGNAYYSLGDFKRAIEYFEQDLSVAKEVKDRAGEGKSYGNIGLCYHRFSDFKRAIQYHEQRLSIAKEVGDKDGEGRAYCNLGNAYHSLCDFELAIKHHEQSLNIAKDVGDKAGTGRAYGNLENACYCLGDFNQAIELHKQHLSIAKAVGDKVGEGTSYGNLGRAYDGLGDFKQAMEYYQEQLSIVKEYEDMVGEGACYSNLGNTYYSLGDFNRAIECHKQHLNIAKELGDRAGEGNANCNLGNAYYILQNFEQAKECCEEHLSIAKEIRDRAGEGKAYANLGNVHYSLGDFKRAIEYHKQDLDIAKEVGDKAGVGISYGNLGTAHGGLRDFKRAIEYHEQHLTIAKEVGDRNGEGRAYYSLGCDYESSGSLREAVLCYRSSISLYNNVRNLLQSEDAWKITFRNACQDAYTALWRALVKLGKTEEALYVAEEGRAQALMDLMKRQYNLECLSSGSCDAEKTISDTLSDVSTQTVFLSLESSTIHMWLLRKGKNAQFRQKVINEPENAATLLERLMKDAFKENRIGVRVTCENRSLDEETDNLPYNRESDQETTALLQGNDNALRHLLDYIVGPIADVLQGDELIIVPDGPLCLAPFAVFLDEKSRFLSESTRIRMIPSLTSLKLIANCPEGYHNTTGALLVGDPCLEEVKKRRGKPKFMPLPFAREEVNIIGEIIKTTPLVGKKATKDEVLKRITSVALVHIAAHGKMETGEIALAPNPLRKSKIPREEDYILKISDMQAVQLHAKLVVLSCCHSAQGKVTPEGVVGIARAFLGAGARSVLVSLWAIDDEATMEFMASFYQHLKDGKNASLALNLAMKCLRESEKFNAVKYWAPFTLIGDDVTLEFGDQQ